MTFRKKDFNYNRTINKAFKQTKSEYVGFFNNDVLFTDNWANEIILQMKKYKALSASPFCPISMKNNNNLSVNLGYEIRKHIAGWAIVVNRKVFDLIGEFDETFNFWRSDDIYAKQIKNKGIKHIICYNSIVKHLDNGSNTLKLEKNKTELTSNEYLKQAKLNYDIRFSVVMPCYLGYLSKCCKKQT